MTKAEWAKLPADYKGVRGAAETETHGAYRFRRCMTHGCTLVNVYITDMKTVEIPKNSRKAPGILPGRSGSTFMHHDLKHRIQAMRVKLEGRAPVAEIRGSSQLFVTLPGMSPVG